MAIKYPDYNNSIMNVSNSFLKYYNVPTNYEGVKELDEVLKAGYDHIIYVLLDGMGSNIVTLHLTEDQALRKYMKREITSVFPPTTVAATNAVLSGLPPISTGYLGWVQYFEKEDTDLAVFLNKDFYDDTKTFDYMIRDKYLTYEDILQKAHRYNPDLKATRLFPEYIGGVSKSFKDAVDKALLIAHNNDKSFTYLYWVQPDLVEHKFGIDSKEVKDMLQSLNTEFEELIANVPDNTLVVALADHGLADVVELNIYKYELLMSYLKRKPSIEPRATSFFVKEENINDFKEEFNKHFKDIYRLYSKQEFYDSKLFGEGEIHPLVDMFVGDFMSVAIDSTMFTLNDVKSYKAHHAGLTTGEMMVPLIIYSKK